MTTTATIEVANFINGQWEHDSSLETLAVNNPSTGETIGNVPLSGPAEVDRAVQAAAAAFPAWRHTSALERARVMFRFKHLLEEHFDEISRLLTREHGKALVDAQGDLRRGIEVVEFASGAPTLMMGDSLENIAGGIDCDTIRQPLGVCVGITPFNFPAMVPMWMFPIALACGNTFVLKPSEQVPLTMQRVVELLEEAGLPSGVMNIVHGQKEAVQPLITHETVQAVSFVGSSPVARYIYETAAAHGKRVQAAGGAKNFMLITPDANMDAMVPGVMGSSFGCAGERCMAGSVAVTIGGAHEPVVQRLVEGASALRVGATDQDDQVEMGPVVSGPHLEKVRKYIDVGLDEGATLARDGRDIVVAEAPEGFYLGPTIFDNVQPDMRIAQEEIFGPVLTVMHMDDIDEAIAAINATGFGNGASIFTNSGKAAQHFKNNVNAGMIGVNVGVPATMAFFPFAGWAGSFYGDLHMQGSEGVQFYTHQKVTMSRWP
jgi:malonate-semialdehyde dehydrogenase (acetylating)/methylmalonate-semialdehyde dehydrogenase